MGLRLANLGQLRPSVDRFQPSLAELRPNLGVFSRMSANLGQHYRLNSGNFERIEGQSRPNLVDFAISPGSRISSVVPASFGQTMRTPESCSVGRFARHNLAARRAPARALLAMFLTLVLPL